jgi:hypothetical protein
VTSPTAGALFPNDNLSGGTMGAKQEISALKKAETRDAALVKRENKDVVAFGATALIVLFMLVLVTGKIRSKIFRKKPKMVSGGTQFQEIEFVQLHPDDDDDDDSDGDDHDDGDDGDDNGDERALLGKGTGSYGATSSSTKDDELDI